MKYTLSESQLAALESGQSLRIVLPAPREKHADYRKWALNALETTHPIHEARKMNLVADTSQRDGEGLQSIFGSLSRGPADTIFPLWIKCIVVLVGNPADIIPKPMEWPATAIDFMGREYPRCESRSPTSPSST